MLIVEEGAAEERAAAAEHARADEDENPLEAGGRLQPAAAPRARRQGGDRPRRAVRQAEVLDRDRLGSGYGYAKGNGLEARTDLQDIFLRRAAPGRGSATSRPNSATSSTPASPISLEGRFQYIPQPSKYAKFTATGALSVLAKVTLLHEAEPSCGSSAAVIAGGGEGFRFVVKPAQGAQVAGMDLSDFQDTVLGGPFIAGVGAGVYFELAKGVSLVAEVDGLAGMPTFSFVTDLNVGFQVNFY